MLTNQRLPNAGTVSFMPRRLCESIPALQKYRRTSRWLRKGRITVFWPENDAATSPHLAVDLVVQVAHLTLQAVNLRALAGGSTLGKLQLLARLLVLSECMLRVYLSDTRLRKKHAPVGHTFKLGSTHLYNANVMYTPNANTHWNLEP